MLTRALEPKPPKSGLKTRALYEQYFRTCRNFLLFFFCLIFAENSFLSYSKDTNRSTGGTRKIGEFTNSFKKIMGYFADLYKETTNPTVPIRRIIIGLNNLQDDYMASISLFDDVEAQEKEKKLREAVVDIKKKYGKNIILKGISYTEKATARSRNKMVGGHNGGD